MPRKGKRSQAQKLRWSKLDLADPAPLSPPVVPKVQSPQPRNVWKTDGPSLAKKMAETPPPARPLWTMEQSRTPLNSPPPKTPPQPRNFWKTDGPTDSPSPAKKMDETPPPARSCWTMDQSHTPLNSPPPKMTETPPPARPFWTMDQSHTPVNSPPPKVIKIQTPPQPRHFWRTDAPTGSRSPARKPTNFQQIDAPSGSYLQAKKVDHWTDEDPQFEKPSRQRGAIWSVRATHSQNDDRYSAFSRNHQCTCMALTFLAYLNEGLRFNTRHLDRVLLQGDSLYVGIKNQLLLDQSYVDDHLTFEEMPKQVLTDTNIYNVHMSSVRCGCLKVPEHSPVGWLPLAKQLEALTSEVSHAALMVSPECFAVFRDSSGRFGLFDSHSRSGRGFPHPEGTAVMLTFNHLSDLINHLHKLFQDRGCYASYEFVPISFQSVNSSERPGQAAEVDTPESATTVPHPDTKSQTAFNIPEAQLSVEAQSPENNACKAQPKDLDVNPGAEQKTKAGRNVSKLNKQRRRKAMRASKSTPCQLTSISKKQNESLKSASRSEFQIKKLQAMRAKYTQDYHYRKQKLLISEYYYADPRVQCKKRSCTGRRYKTDPEFQIRHKNYIAQRYDTDSNVRESKKTYVTSKYTRDQDHRKKLKAYIRSRYARDQDYRQILSALKLL